ncbi:MAG TPA: DUF4105 domain-containing protein [Longimicrobiales bacterium]|nr:DUF4105 domain-containing protein [Longimicrobiales bacterium]
MKKPILLATSALLLLALASWSFIRPSNDRDWSIGQDRLPRAELEADAVTIHDLRNFEYDAAGQPTALRYDARSYDLGQLQTVWFVLAPFEPDNRGPAHSFLSFGFADSQYLAVSVEARKEKDETYSIVKGLLKRYELMYVLGDERDLVRLRVARGDDVYLYPIKTSPEKVRALFVRILEHANRLHDKPEFYNTLTNNCTTNILEHANSIASRKIPYGREVLLPGYADELARELGLIDTDLPIAEARRRFHINARARRAFHDSAFSTRIRTEES